jgi:TolB protein
LLKKELEGVRVSGSFRKAAHAAADKIYERITGEAGFFCTRFLLVESYALGKKIYKKLVLVDQDGQGRKEVVSNKEKFVLSAKAAPDGTIAYLAIVDNKIMMS